MHGATISTAECLLSGDNRIPPTRHGAGRSRLSSPRSVIIGVNEPPYLFASEQFRTHVPMSDCPVRTWEDTQWIQETRPPRSKRYSERSPIPIGEQYSATCPRPMATRSTSTISRRRSNRASDRPTPRPLDGHRTAPHAPADAGGRGRDNGRPGGRGRRLLRRRGDRSASGVHLRATGVRDRSASCRHQFFRSAPVRPSVTTSSR